MGGWVGGGGKGGEAKSQRQCSETTAFEAKEEPKRNRTEILRLTTLLTNVSPLGQKWLMGDSGQAQEDICHMPAPFRTSENNYNNNENL